VTPTRTPTATPSATGTVTPTPTATASVTPTPTATLGGGCPSTPAACLTAERNKLALKYDADPSRRRFSWKWSRGATVLTQASFGNPLTGSTAYTLCLYDQNAGTPVFEMDATIAPAGTCGTRPCWKAVSDRGWSYNNRNGVGNGVNKTTLLGGAAGRPKVQINGKGADLRLPVPQGIRYFTADTAVIVQLHSSNPPACWSSTFNSPGIVRNDSSQFKAHSP
jgi:hypothetical protein